MGKSEQDNMEEEELQGRGETGASAGAAIGGEAGGSAGDAIGTAYGGPIGGMVGQYVGEQVGEHVGEQVGDQLEDSAYDQMDELLGEELPEDEEDEDEAEEEEEQEQQKKKGGACGGGANKGDQSSDSAEYPSGGDPEKDLGQVGMDDVDASVNSMCKKVYTVFRAIPKEYECPGARRDNVADQFTPQDDLVTMEKTCRDFLKLESKIYDPESTNPRFFASEGWVQHYEKDKNVVLAALDQYKANILRMEHLYTVVDNNSYSKLLSIPNQDSKESFQTNIWWTARALKEWGNNWFIKRNAYSSTKLYDEDYWVPGLTGQMIEWMKLGTYNEFCMNNISNETMVRKVDLLEGVIDRLMSKSTVADVISQYVNLKETIESSADQGMDKIFTSKVIDSQMGKKLGVTATGTENHEIEGTTYVPPKEDAVEQYNLVCKLSCVKNLFKQFREKSLETMKQCRCVSPSGGGPYPQIWTNIDVLSEPVYTDLNIFNELVEDFYNDAETPGKHCSITHQRMCPIQLRQRITSFKCIVMDGVVDVMTHQAMLPKKGKNILDSMFNQLWEYGEKGPTLEMPSWCLLAIDSINAFEKSMMDAWSEVYDCWEREFITRLWSIEVEHHTSNWERVQTRHVKTIHNHQHAFAPMTMMTTASIGGDTKNMDITPLKGVMSCPGHLERLMKPVCIQYRVFNVAHLARNFRSDVKALCQWLVSAIEAVGIKQAAISAVMSDPTLNGDCANAGCQGPLGKINELREKNHKLLEKVEHAYGMYSDVNNMKNKKEWDEEMALHELQPNKFSNEDQLNMSSSVQSETNESTLDAELCQGGIDIPQLKPWNHLSPSANKVTPQPLPVTCACNKFDKIIKTVAGFETFFAKEDDKETPPEGT